MPQTDRIVIKRRAAVLRKVGDRSKFVYFNRLIGKVKNVLVESNNRGYTESYAPVQLENDVNRGEIVKVMINESSPHGLTGTVIKNFR